MVAEVSAAAALVAGTAPDVDVDDAGRPVGRGAAEINVATRVDGQSEALRSDFVDAAAALDADGVERTLDRMFSGGWYQAVVERDILPALRALGDAWATGRVDIAGEHAASHGGREAFVGSIPSRRAPTPAEGAVLVGLPPGAHHELGALAFAVAARRAGLPVLYLGPDLPVDDWVATARRVHARAAVVGAVAQSDGAAALDVARALIDGVPGIIVAFGGSGAPTPNPTTRWSGHPPSCSPPASGTRSRPSKRHWLDQSDEVGREVTKPSVDHHSG